MRANSDQFGWSVAIKNDKAYVGAFHKHDQRGEVFIFERNNFGNAWGNLIDKPNGLPTGEETYSIRPNDFMTQNNFGWSIAITDIDNDLIIGARLDNEHRGAVYVFKEKGSFA